jgi:hypothetical protein
MAQIVFIHGVATRTGEAFEKGTANRDRLLRKMLFPDDQVTIRSPIWGDLVPEIDQAIFEIDADVPSFSLGMGGGLAAGDASLGATAKTHPTAALDALFAELVEKHERDRTELSDDELSAFGRAAKAIENDEVNGLIGDADDDASLSLALATDEAMSHFGIGGSIKSAIAAVTDRARNIASSIGFGLVRDTVSPAVGMFLGDVFAYLHAGETRHQIRQRVALALVEAQQERAAGEPLVVIAHSMGGVILIDLLSDPEIGELPDSLTIDALLTVGSQPGLFRALSAIGPQGAGHKLKRPSAIAHWFNVFDPIDPLAFRADPVFDGVLDVQFDSVTGLISAHTTYFSRPQFYARARARLREAGIDIEVT